MRDNLPMCDVVQSVLEAEQASKRILQEAETAAEGIVTEARRQAQDIMEAARCETIEQADALVLAAQRECEHERQRRMEQAAADIEAMVRLDEELAESAVKAVLRCVCGRR